MRQLTTAWSSIHRGGCYVLVRSAGTPSGDGHGYWTMQYGPEFDTLDEAARRNAADKGAPTHVVSKLAGGNWREADGLGETEGFGGAPA